MSVKIGSVNIHLGKTIMPFGKYEGEYLDDIPDEYLEWLRDDTNIEYTRPGLYKIICILLDRNQD